MNAIYFLLALTLVACGSDDQTADDKLKQTDDGGDIHRQPEEPKSNVVEYHKENGKLALALEDTKDLPACTFENEQQLAYIKKTEQFFACTEETWVEIPMEAKEGVAGAQGPVGPEGPKGDDGAPAVANQWFDPMSEDTWLVGAVVPQQTILLGPDVCSGNYRMATSAELQTAVLHGLSLASGDFDGPVNFWSSDTMTSGTDQLPVYVNAAGQANISNALVPTGVACIADEG